jgi:site-specific DNA recombinase
MLKVICYARVSTEEQAEEGVSLQAQTARMKAYAELYALEIVDVIEDAGVSAKTLDRPGLKAALARLKRGEVAGLLIAKIDRLSRTVADWNYLIGEYFDEKAGKQLFSVGDQIDTRTAAGRLVLNVLMSVSQWEREVISERTKEAFKYMKSKGHKLGGSVPYGFQLGAPTPAAKKTLVPCELEQQNLALMRQLRADGLTLAAIGDELTARGITRRQGKRWDVQYLHRLIKRAA